MKNTQETETGTNLSQLNVKLIRKKIEGNPKYKAALKILANRERARADATFPRIYRMLREGGLNGWDIKEMAKFLEVLQEGGAGVVKMGDTGPRFIWAFHLRSIARAVLGMPDKAAKERGGELPPPVLVKKRHFPRIEEATMPIDTEESEGGDLHMLGQAHTRRSTDMAPSVTVAPSEHSPRAVTATATAKAINGNTLVIHRGGAEIEIDLDKIPPEAVRFVRFVG